MGKSFVLHIKTFFFLFKFFECFHAAVLRWANKNFPSYLLQAVCYLLKADIPMTFVSFSGQSVLTFLAPCSPNLVFFFSSQNLILPPFLESLPVLHFSSAMRCARHIPGESHWCLVQKPLVFVWFTLLTITYFSKSALWTTDKHQAVFYYTSVQVTFFFFLSFSSNIHLDANF